MPRARLDGDSTGIALRVDKELFGAGANLEDIVTAMTRAITEINRRMSEALSGYAPGLGFDPIFNQFPGMQRETAGGNNFFINANYPPEDRDDLLADLRLLVQLYGNT